jgi:hypothetical protein
MSSTRIVHMSLSVRGALKNWDDSDFSGLMINEETGEYLTSSQAKDALLDELLKGHEIIPFGAPCEGFDYGGGGCPGHDTVEEPAP